MCARGFCTVDTRFLVMVKSVVLFLLTLVNVRTFRRTPVIFPTFSCFPSASGPYLAAMPLVLGMDKFLKGFEPVELRNRLQLKVPENNIKQTRRDVARWYKTATALEEIKSMKSEMPRVEAIVETVEKQVNYASGNYYKGQWLNGKRHGKGEYLSETEGMLYRGEWKEDTIHGQGSMFKRMPDKSWFMAYIGEHKNGLKDGWGTYRWSDNEFYEGFWAKGKREERGRQFSPDGTVYEDQWLDDVKEGYGATREGSNNHHFGEYSLSQKNGAGKYYFVRTGKVLRGVWQRDIPVFGDVIQLQHYKPTFPHQYPMPELGLAHFEEVLEDSLNDVATLPDYITPRTSLGGRKKASLPGTKSNMSKMQQEAAKAAAARRGMYDMLQLLRDIEPDVAEVTDPIHAAKTADLFVTAEYLWRDTADAYQTDFTEEEPVPGQHPVVLADKPAKEDTEKEPLMDS